MRFLYPYCVVVLILSTTQLLQAAEMLYPLSVAATDKGPLYVADRKLPGIWSVEQGKAASYFTGSKVFRTPLNAVRCVTIDNEGRVLAGDSSTREVYRFEKAGAKPQPLTNGGIGIPMDVVVLKNGDLLVSDLELHHIWKVPAAGGKPTLFAKVEAPRGLALDQAENLWVVSGTADQLLKVSPEGKVAVVVKGRPFNFPHDVVVLDDGSAKRHSGKSLLTELPKNGCLANLSSIRWESPARDRISWSPTRMRKRYFPLIWRKTSVIC